MVNRQPAVGVLDLGASGGRVFAVALDGNRLRLHEMHRFAHAPQRYWQSTEGGAVVSRYCWSLGCIYAGLLEGLARIAQRSDLALQSFGIDTWGSDGTWVNAEGDVLGLVGTGRDPRWQAAQAELSREVSECELFRLTGTRSEPFCVLNQLYWYARHQPQVVAAAAAYLPINSLLHYYLSGQQVAERTWMSTTQLNRPGEDGYQQEVFDRLQLPLAKMPPLVAPGMRLGYCHRQLAETVGLAPFEVIVPATHDTASAYAAAPVQPGRKPILISSGTWTLVGIAEADPLVTDAAYEAGLTNIAGCEEVFLHAVIMGSWPAQELRRHWSLQERRDLPWELVDQWAVTAPPLKTVLDIDNPLFYAPLDMETAIADYCRRTGQEPPANRGEVARAVYEGLALKTAMACDAMQAVSGYVADEIVIVGGGSRNTLVSQWIADATRLPVRTGPDNATGLGNALIQGRSLGWYGTLAQGRELLEIGSQGRVFEPQTGGSWEWAKSMIQKHAAR
jgi:rhamnulokinase